MFGRITRKVVIGAVVAALPIAAVATASALAPYEHVTNGKFDVNVSNWSGGLGDFSWANGQGIMKAGAGGSAMRVQCVPVEANTRFNARATVFMPVSSVNGLAYFAVQEMDSADCSTPSTGTVVDRWTNVKGSQVTLGNQFVTKASTKAVLVAISVTGPAGATYPVTAAFDNISIANR